MENRIDRAKQFMPFAALRGYYELVRDKERIVEPRRELSEEASEELSMRLSLIQKGMILRVRYYRGEAYESVQGVVTRFDPVFRILTIVKTQVRFGDIIAVSGDALDELWQQRNSDTY